MVMTAHHEGVIFQSYDDIGKTTADCLMASILTDHDDLFNIDTGPIQFPCHSNECATMTAERMIAVRMLGVFQQRQLTKK